ncbi:MAG: hypothetical protein K2V38_22885, partial [Gemmataceae bacterium]|nr:hypothetical protein [Gemmataceae bacterium]
MRRLLVPALVLAVFLGLTASAQPPKTAAQPEPKFIDDEEFYEDLYDKVEELAKAKKLLAHDKLVAKMKKAGPAKIATAKAGDKALSPEEVYKRAEKSVFVVASVYPDKAGNWERGTYATAWVASADGVLVTN